jgi:hypothetical protein
VVIANGSTADASYGDNNRAMSVGANAHTQAGGGNNNSAYARGRDALAFAGCVGVSDNCDDNRASAVGLESAADAVYGSGNTADARSASRYLQ